MQYRSFGKLDIKVSALGFGAMRLPTFETCKGQNTIDESVAIKMIHHAIDNGVNYVDTAYPYHEGMSEVLVGKALKDGYREKTYLATKCPVWAIDKPEDFDCILDEQLKKLDVTYVDFYLLHSLNMDSWNNKVLKYDLLTKMEEAKKAGKIKYIGFSFHDNAKSFITMVDGYEHWDFCQIQLNYIDVDNQATIKGLEYAASKGLGIVIMEPLLGGKLANPPVNVANILKDSKTPVEWALDFLWNRPEVSLLLSGMSDMAQTTDNITYADRSSIEMLSKEDLTMLAESKKIYDTMALVSCTKCAYCMPCPFGLDIPTTFEAYNRTATVGMEKASAFYSSIETKADACKKCKKCESVCPQKIKISDVMSTINDVFLQGA